jgi:hypothetical protein
MTLSSNDPNKTNVNQIRWSYRLERLAGERNFHASVEQPAKIAPPRSGEDDLDHDDDEEEEEEAGGGKEQGVGGSGRHAV